MDSVERGQADPAGLATMGDLLLKGWTMLGEGCQDCKVPLMQDPQSGGKLCVSCQTTKRSSPSCSETGEAEIDMQIEDGSDGDIHSWRSEHQMVTDKPGSEGSQAEKLALRMMQVQYKIHRHVAVFKFLGGTFLRTCNTPLVRNKEQALFCVECDLGVFTTATDPAQSNTPTSIRSGQKRVKPSSRLVEKNKMIKPDGQEKASKDADVLNDGSKSDNEWKELTKRVLQEKIEGAARALQSLPSSDPTDCLRMVELLEKCLDTIIKLESLPD